VCARGGFHLCVGARSALILNFGIAAPVEMSMPFIHLRPGRGRQINGPIPSCISLEAPCSGGCTSEMPYPFARSHPSALSRELTLVTISPPRTRSPARVGAT
jgi:hypothetical protein